MRVDQGNQAAEVLGCAMGVQRCAIRPLLNEYEVAGILLVDEQVVGDAQRFAPRAGNQLAV